MVYDITKRTTFINAKKWLDEIRQNTEPHCKIMLIGNKLDLIERSNRKREVAFEEGKEFAEENQLLFAETSALSNMKVTESFEDLLQEIYNEKRKVSRVQKRNNNQIILGTTNAFNEGGGRSCC